MLGAEECEALPLTMANVGANVGSNVLIPFSRLKTLGPMYSTLANVGANV